MNLVVTTFVSARRPSSVFIDNLEMIHIIRFVSQFSISINSLHSPLSTMSNPVTAVNVDPVNPVNAQPSDSGTEIEMKRGKWRKYKTNQLIKLRRSGDYEKRERTLHANREKAAAVRGAYSEEGKSLVSMSIAAYRAEVRNTESRNRRFYRLFLRRLQYKQKKDPMFLPEECVALISSHYDRSIGKYAKLAPSYPAENCADRDAVIRDVKWAFEYVDSLIERAHRIPNSVTKSCLKSLHRKYIAFPYTFFEIIQNYMYDQ